MKLSIFGAALLALLTSACAAPSLEVPAPIAADAASAATPTVRSTPMTPPAVNAGSSPRAAAAPAQESEDAAAEMARKLQNPLASMRALMTDNAIGFNTGTDKGTSYGFLLQPVYAIDLEDRGLTIIPRAVIPVLGLEPGTFARPVGTPVPGTEEVWGLGDTALQLFLAPHTDAKWKWGVGPQLSLPTATDPKLTGADWGAGLAGIVTTSLTPNVSFSAILANMWSFDGSFNTMTIQPTAFYNFPTVPGVYAGYNAAINFNWEADSSNQVTLPVGVTLGKTVATASGNGFDFSIGPYYNAVRPDGAADWVLRFGISWLAP